jgi:outer membrane protein OmpA-like peptidoglycan-associated protein
MYFVTTPRFAEAADDIGTELVLRPGSRGSAVTDLQRKLNAWATQSSVAVPPLVEDGHYGPVTAARVRTFQQAVGLPADGIAGSQTQQQLARFAGGPVSPRISPGECERIRKSCELLAKFDFDKSTLRPEHFPIINGIAQCVVDSFGTPTPIRSILVIGHTDTRGPDWYNCELGRKRAAAVRTVLGQAIARECMTRGLRPCPVSLGQILTQSFGEKNALPGVSGDDAQNRRVEVCLFTTHAPQLRPGACSAVPPKPQPPDCTKTPQDPRCRRPPPDCSVQSHPDCPPDCVKFPEDPRCPPKPPPRCDQAELDRRNRECLKQAGLCAANCGLDHFLSKIKRVPQYIKLLPKILPCTRLRNPYLIAACILATVGPDLLKDDFNDLNRIVNCLKGCKDTFEACRSRAKVETGC